MQHHDDTLLLPSSSQSDGVQIHNLKRNYSSDPVHLIVTAAGSSQRYIAWEIDAKWYRENSHPIYAHPWEFPVATKLIEWATTGKVPADFKEVA